MMKMEKSKDLISRADAIEAVYEYFPQVRTREQAEIVLEYVPSASAEQVTGKLNNCDDSLLTSDAEAVKEKQSKLDLVSRSDAVNEIHKYFVEEIDKTPYTKDEDGDDVYTDMPTVISLLVCNKELAKRIKALPSASVETEMSLPNWIPCSERFPEDLQKAITCNKHGKMMIGTYTEWGWMFPCYFEKPIAWMPLPMPYREDGEA